MGDGRVGLVEGDFCFREAVDLARAVALLRPDAALEDDPVDPVRLDRGDDRLGRAAVVVQRLRGLGGRVDPVDGVDVGRGGDDLARVAGVGLPRLGVLGDVGGNLVRVAGEQDRPDPGANEHARQVAAHVALRGRDGDLHGVPSVGRVLLRGLARAGCCVRLPR